MNINRAVLVITFMLLVVEGSAAREWRGIAPLRSTRADVVRLLNQCSEQREACVFILDNEEVYILFSGGLGKNYLGRADLCNPSTSIRLDRVSLPVSTGWCRFNSNWRVIRYYKAWANMDRERGKNKVRAAHSFTERRYHRVSRSID